MRLSPLLALPITAASLLPSPQHILSNPPDTPSNGFRIPTVHESAVLARRILHLSTIATLSTIFPTTSTLENRPSDVQGSPIGLMDYIADCLPHGDPTILAISIATSFKNVDAGSNISLSLSWTPPSNPHPYSPASLPRYSLIGYLEDIPEVEAIKQGIPACFVKKHPDAKWWLPGNPIHESHWVKFVVKEVYWIGGFGDRAYIGWIPKGDWANVTAEEIHEAKLPGEKKAESALIGSLTGWVGRWFEGKDDGWKGMRGLESQKESSCAAGEGIEL